MSVPYLNWQENVWRMPSAAIFLPSMSVNANRDLKEMDKWNVEVSEQELLAQSIPKDQRSEFHF